MVDAGTWRGVSADVVSQTGVVDVTKTKVPISGARIALAVDFAPMQVAAHNDLERLGGGRVNEEVDRGKAVAVLP